MKYLLILLLLSGCAEVSQDLVDYQTSCETKEDRKALADFIVNCSKAANPMSDEEGEDLVAQCENSGRRTICPKVKMCKTIKKGRMGTITDFGSWIPCEEKK